MNKLAKVKSYLRSQLADEFLKPITDQKSLIKTRDAIKLLVSMVGKAYGLPCKHDDSTTAINLIDAQLEKINAQVTFAREQLGDT